MAKARGLEAKLDQLRALRRDSHQPEHVPILRDALRDRSNFLVADAAEIVGERMLSELMPELTAAFDRFMEDGEETDKGCRAKIAIVETLNKLDHQDETLLLRGLTYVQIEGRWGQPEGEDTAATLRGVCAFGLVRFNRPDIVLLLAELLADKEKIARCAAAQALGETRAPAAIPLLLYKARVGDRDPEVVGDCLGGLMTAAPRESLSFVAEFLRSPEDEIAQGAALALGESRRPEAFEVLRNHWPRARRTALAEVLLLAISMSRLPGAMDFLLEIVAARTDGLAALSALAIHRHNEPLRERIAKAVDEAGDVKLAERYRKKFLERE